MTHVDPKAPADHPDHPSQVERRLREATAGWSSATDEERGAYACLSDTHLTATERDASADVANDLLLHRDEVVAEAALTVDTDQPMVARLIDETGHWYTWRTTEDDDSQGWVSDADQPEDSGERGAYLDEPETEEGQSRVQEGEDADQPVEPDAPAPPAQDAPPEPKVTRRGRKVAKSSSTLDDKLKALDGLGG